MKELVIRVLGRMEEKEEWGNYLKVINFRKLLLFWVRRIKNVIESLGYSVFKVFVGGWCLVG